MFSHTNFNSSVSVATWRNVSLLIALITFLAYKKTRKSYFECFLFASRFYVIFTQV